MRFIEIVNEDDRPFKNFGLLHSLNFMYLTMAHQGDGQIEPEEMEKSAEFVFKYAVESESLRVQGFQAVDDYARQVLTKSLEVYQEFLNMGRDKVFEVYSFLLGNAIESFPPEYLGRIYDELYAVAEADGSVTGGEKVILEKTAKAWGLDR